MAELRLPLPLQVPGPGSGDGPQLPDPGSRPDQAGPAARRVLSGGDYHHRAAARSVIQRIEDWIRRHLPHIRTGGQHGMPTAVSYGIVAVLAVLVVGALVWGIVQVRRGRRADGTDDGDTAEAGDIEITPLRSADQWRAEAERLEAAGRWRDALRARYRSTVGLLIDRELLDDLPGRTPGEHRIELAAAVPAAGPPFDTATTLFEASWYGHRPTDADDVEQFRELADHVSAVAVKPRRGPADDERGDEPEDSR